MRATRRERARTIRVECMTFCGDASHCPMVGMNRDSGHLSDGNGRETRKSRGKSRMRPARLKIYMARCDAISDH